MVSELFVEIAYIHSGCDKQRLKNQQIQSPRSIVKEQGKQGGQQEQKEQLKIEFHQVMFDRKRITGKYIVSNGVLNIF